MDYLPIQASAVPCEHIFSSAGETDTKKRNRIKPALMEALQILKFIYKKERLDFSLGLKFSTCDSEDLSSDLLGDVLTKDSADATDYLLQLLGDDDSDEGEK